MAGRRAVLVGRADAERLAALTDALRGAGWLVERVAPGVPVPVGDPSLEWMVVALDDPSLDRARLAQAVEPGTAQDPGSLRDAERRHLARMLHFTAGNRREAALRLGISRSTLLAKLRRLGLDGPLTAGS